jgi:MFS family permease
MAGDRKFLDLNRYQWTVMLAAWLGWGFDIFDGLLFNFVAPNCVPTLLDIPLGTPEAKAATVLWAGILTTVLLLGWAIGGILFGAITDRIGRTRTLLLTMLLYSLGTAACAFAPNIWVLLACRAVASLGIGGEWAAGASIVAEVVPEHRRVEAGALLYTSAPLGLFLATFVDWYVAGNLFLGDPAHSWRYVFLCGLIPAGAAFFVRLFVKEPERWQAVAQRQQAPSLRELFTPELRRSTIGGLLLAVTALLTWWSCNAFIVTIASGLAQHHATDHGIAAAEMPELIASWKRNGNSWFNLGGLVGTLLTVPISKRLGRRAMFGLYFAASAVAILCTFGLPLRPEVRLLLYLPIGLSVFGVFGSFTYYLTELFPTRLRGTGAGFCYNAGRLLAAGGPWLVASIASRGADAYDAAVGLQFFIGFVPLAGLLCLPLVTETKGRTLAD